MLPVIKIIIKDLKILISLGKKTKSLYSDDALIGVLVLTNVRGQLRLELRPSQTLFAISPYSNQFSSQVSGECARFDSPPRLRSIRRLDLEA